MATMLSSQGPDRRFASEANGRRMLQIAQNLRELSSRDTSTSTAAETRLGELVPTSQELVYFTNDRNPFVRSGAAWWLRNLGPTLTPEAIDALRGAATDPNAHVIQAALGTVGVLRLTEAREDALACLDDSNPNVVHSAIFALGRIGPAELGDKLVPFLDRKEPHLETAAVQAITNLRYAPAIPKLIERLGLCRGVTRRTRQHFELPRRYMVALVALQAREAVSLLVELARDEIGLRGLAVQALIDLRAPEAAPALLPLLVQLQSGSHEEKLCCSLLYLMTAVDYRFAMPQVREFLTHRLPGVRCAALKAVTRWHDTDAAGVIRTLVQEDPSAFVRPCAVTALGDLLGSEVLPELPALAVDSNALVRAAVVEVLAKLVPQGRELLLRMVDDPAAPVARVAREVLQLHPREASETDQPPAGPAGVPVDLRCQAAAARAFLLRWLSQLDQSANPDHQPVAKALDTLLPLLSD